MAYSHGFRVSELIDVRLEEIDLRTARMWVRLLKGSLSAKHPAEGDDLRVLQRLDGEDVNWFSPQTLPENRGRLFCRLVDAYLVWRSDSHLLESERNHPA